MFQLDAPEHVIRDALILQKTKKGMPKDQAEKTVDEKLKETENDPDLWEEIVKSLNKKLETNAFDADPELVEVD